MKFILDELLFKFNKNDLKNILKERLLHIEEENLSNSQMPHQ